MLKKLSLQMSLVIGIAIMGILGMTLAMYVDVSYRQIAVDHQRLALEEIIRLRVSDLMEELEKYSRDLGQSVQNNNDFRRNLIAQDSDAVTSYLQQHFHQYFVTAGILKLNSLIALDLNFKQIAKAENDLVITHARGGATCKSLHDQARLRSGVDRLKVISELCLTDGYPFMHALIPIGGLRLLGYLEVVTDPTYTVAKIEQNLGLPLRISFLDNTNAYESDRWPGGMVPEHTILATYIPKTGTGQDAFKLSVIQDIKKYELQLRDTRTALMLTVAMVVVIVSVLIFLLVKYTTVRPMQKLALHLRKIQHDSKYLGTTINITGNKDVQTLASGLNEMTIELKRLYDELQQTNQDLMSEIKVRENAEVQLKLSRVHLEELVEKRTADLAVARDTALKASQSKSQFLANMSHELRTPLNAIIGYTELLLEDAQELNNLPVYEDLTKVHSAARHLLILIKDVLDLTKIEAGKIELDLGYINISSFIKEMCHTIQPLMDASVNEFEVDCHEDIGVVYVDATKLRQTLLNLLSNAAKFTKQGKVQLQVKRYNDNGVEKMIFSVKDNGIGLSNEEISRIFDPFTQADSSTTRKYGGTGLGLAISRNFCQLMGGDLTVKSEKGVGSEFFVIIPVKVKDITHVEFILDEYDEILDARHHRIGEYGQNNERRSYISSILFVNEESILARQFARYFELKGFSSKIATDADTCLYQLERQHFDVVVIELEIANAQDWQLLRTIQKLPGVQNRSVVLLGDRLLAEKGISLGVVDCLAVPTDKTMLQAVINNCVRNRVTQSEAKYQN